MENEKTGTAIASNIATGLEKTPAQKQREKVGELLTKYKAQLQQALPKHITADRLIRVAMTAINKTPKLLECTTSSLIGCIVNSAQLGLMPDGVIGEGYLIPFMNNKANPPRMECQFMIGYRGLITLAHRSGQVKSLQARAVYAKDEFKYEFGLSEVLVHKPTDQVKRGDLTHAYCVVHFTNGGYVFDVMTKAEVEHIRDFSKAPNSPAWKEHYSEMAIKTIIRKIAKRCPLSPEFVNAAMMDERVEVLGQSQDNSKLLLDLPQGELSEEATKELDDDATAERTAVKNDSINRSKATGQGAASAVEFDLKG